MQHFYQDILKEGNDDQKFWRCRDLWDKNFEVLHSAMSLYKVDLECAETVKDKPSGINSGFITYSNTIKFSGIWLDNSIYLITKWQ